MFKYLFPFLVICFFSSSISASEDVPDDIRYMLEDMYGAKKEQWPESRYKVDLNKDGFTDWVVKKNDCESKDQCSVEIFICNPNKNGTCSEYCYMEVKTLKNIEATLSTRKCESTC